MRRSEGDDGFLQLLPTAARWMSGLQPVRWVDLHLATSANILSSGVHLSANIRADMPSTLLPAPRRTCSATRHSGGVMTADRKRHPSGRPIRKDELRGRPIWRIPDKGPVIPRLQPKEKDITAIGFTARIVADDNDE